MSDSEPSFNYKDLLAADDAMEAIDSGETEQGEAVDSQLEIEPLPTNPPSEAEAALPSPDENNANETAPTNNLEDFTAEDNSKAADKEVEETAAAATPERKSESFERKSSSPTLLKSKSPSPAKSPIPEQKSPIPSKTLSPAAATWKSATPSPPKNMKSASPLSFDSEPPNVPPTSPTNSTEFKKVNRDSITSISELETIRTGSFLWSEESDASQGWGHQEDADAESNAPSYWILPPPGARLAARPLKPSFMVGRKMQLVAQRDAQENMQMAMAAKENSARQRMAEKQTHHGQVLERLADQTDDWWDWKEHVVHNKLTKLKHIEDCCKERGKIMTEKMCQAEKLKLQRQKEKVAQEKKERQEAEILNAWLARASKLSAVEN